MTLSVPPVLRPPLPARTSVHPRQVRLDHHTRARLQAAAEEFGVPAELIAGVLIDEHARLDIWDAIQDRAVRFGLRLPGLLAAGWWRLLGGSCGRPVDSFSLGRAQMKPATLRHLGRLGYVNVPTTAAAVWRLLLDDRQAERLVAACLRATADHWAAGGVAILHRPEVLATLYSLGLTGANGVHAHPVANARGDGIARWAAWLSARGVLASQARCRSAAAQRRREEGCAATAGRGAVHG